MSEPAKQKPLARMLNYVAMKMETLELCYGIPGEGDEPMTWKTEFSKTEHETLNEIFKTLTLVEAFEGDFRQILRRKMGVKPGGR